MSKNLLQDMVLKKRQRRAEMRIPVTDEPKTPVEEYKAPRQMPEHSNTDDYSEIETKFASVYDVVNNKEQRGRQKSKHSLWFVALVSIAFLLFALSFLFSGVKVTISPKVKDVVVNASLSAVKDGRPEDLPFELIVNSGEENRIVPAMEAQDVSLSAGGVVMIYNNFSSTTQRLDIDTRLEGSNGKMYKTKTPTTVPGLKDGTPGSVEVEIYASEAGEEYNSGPLDFKIFGFKGTPKYSKFYARSKGEITGGFEGKKSDIPQAERDKIIGEMETALKEKLFNRAVEQIPEGFVLWQDATILTTGSENITFTSSEGSVSINMKGTLSGFLFEEKKLTEKVAEAVLPNEDVTGVYALNIGDLVFSLSYRENSLVDIKNISFSLSGNLKVVWTMEEESLISDLLGQSKKDFNQILLKYPNIDKAQLSFRPFWKRSFPEEREDIKVTVNYP